jgi:UDP-N-acetylglucosamine 2-epimerase (non-hydrolysing)
MQNLIDNIDKIAIIKNNIANYYKHTCINNKDIANDTITIIMTSHNRSKQVYFTLKTISDSNFKNIQVVIVDDSDKDKVSVNKLQEYPFYIDFIEIDRNKKFWLNPCINYNIGFKHIKGVKIIIQNSEVCHIGDVLSYVNLNITDENYYVFDVKNSPSFEYNEHIYNLPILDHNIFYDNNPLLETSNYLKWYQHSTTRNHMLHFLTSMTYKTFELINEFSYDYSFGNDYDDNDLLLKIKSNNIKTNSVCSETYKIGGIHLYHTFPYTSWNIITAYTHNHEIYIKKENHFKNTGQYIEYYKELEKKTVVTITGIRPDFIRMCNVFKELDKKFNHILIHTGQHYDTNLSDVFFKQLNIRSPDYVLNTGKESSNHFEQISYLSKELPLLLTNHNIKPALILFLGDSNSVGISFPLKKEGYKIGHIEAGMRSYDKRMLEEINRTVCDHCSDILFVYHDDYKEQLKRENIIDNVHVVGNTIVEPFNIFKDEILNIPKKMDMILLDIHRPENFKYIDRLKSILQFANDSITRYNIPVKMLYFKRLQDIIDKEKINLGKIEIIPLLPYKEYLNMVYHSKFIISDSGTGQEEPALLNTKVIVPREFTERPQSYENNCSFKLDLNNYSTAFNWIESNENIMNVEWLGGGTASYKIIEHIEKFLT